MNNSVYEVESNQPFAESLIWQINRSYYEKMGLDAWRKDGLPLQLTSNSMVGRTYAELIFGFLKDLSAKGQSQEAVHILELGAGHGRLTFHILKHLERLTAQVGLDLPAYVYIISDIGSENLNFFEQHNQFKNYIEEGVLDVAYFDAAETTSIELRHSGKTILPQSLKQPILAIGNYFFDSIPNDLYAIKDKTIENISVALHTAENPKIMDEATLLKELHLTFEANIEKAPFYQEPIINEILEEYRESLRDTHIFFPYKGFQCIENIKELSTQGLMLLSIDKGFLELADIEKSEKPEIITHGSFSIWVNYHAYRAFCEKQGGTTFFPAFSTFHLQLGCLLFLPESESYTETKAAYERTVDEFGPDDFNGLKRLTYENLGRMNLMELIAFLRLSAYDSTMFQKVLPRIKQVAQRVTINERTRLAQTMHQTWNMYFTLQESFDLAYEMGGLFYDLGYYQDALNYFEHSVRNYGQKADIYYNQALCYYQLRQDAEFSEILKEAKVSFPDYAGLAHLERLDLGA